MSVDTRVLARMADKKLEEDLVKAGAAGLPANILVALEKKQKEKQEAAAAAADEIMTLLDLQERHINYHVNEIRTARKAIEHAKAALDTINRAKGFGIETGNFLPLAVAVDEYVPREHRELAKIPDGWEPGASKE